MNPLKGLGKDFLATGVGSLPYTDSRAAVDAVLESFAGHMPFWPQLPRRSFYENMYVQFTENFPGMRLDESRKSAWVDTVGPDYLTQFEECFHRIEATDLDYFAISRPYAESLYGLCDRLAAAGWQGWVKAQIIGPVSLGLTLLDESKNPILYNPELFEMLPSFLALKSAWLIRQARVTASTKVVIFVDEPYLVAVGTSQCSLPKETIAAKINQVVRAIHQNGSLAGLHCCGNTDWEMVLNTDIDILNFDAYGYMDKLLIYEKAIARFLKKGGVFAFGIVPNTEDIAQEGLVERFTEILMRHPALLANGALVTTSCGCNALSQELARRALETCAQLAGRLKGEF